MTLSPKEIAGRDLHRERWQRELLEGCQSVVRRGLLADWRVVAAALESLARLMSHRAAFDVGARVEAFVGTLNHARIRARAMHMLRSIRVPPGQGDR